MCAPSPSLPESGPRCPEKTETETPEPLARLQQHLHPRQTPKKYPSRFSNSGIARSNPRDRTFLHAVAEVADAGENAAVELRELRAGLDHLHLRPDEFERLPHRSEVAHM
jgi:hypothetical protein